MRRSDVAAAGTIGCGGIRSGTLRKTLSFGRLVFSGEAR